MNFAQKVRELRRTKEFTQQELADLLGVSLRTVVSYETGKSYPKQRIVYARLAEIFGVDEDYLRIEGDSEPATGGTPREEADRLVERIRTMFAGGSLSEQDRDAVMRALQDAYWDACEEERKK